MWWVDGQAGVGDKGPWQLWVVVDAVDALFGGVGDIGGHVARVPDDAYDNVGSTKAFTEPKGTLTTSGLTRRPSSDGSQSPGGVRADGRRFVAGTVPLATDPPGWPSTPGCDNALAWKVLLGLIPATPFGSPARSRSSVADGSR
ncbi:hypothetical protein ACWCPM_30900 [Streptomyces sp. NPDC002309]